MKLDWELLRAEIAYLLDQEFEGRGLMSEALGLILQACFDSLGLNKVFLRVIVGNDRSRKLAKRFGFIKEGTLRQESPDFGQQASRSGLFRDALE